MTQQNDGLTKEWVSFDYGNVWCILVSMLNLYICSFSIYRSGKQFQTMHAAQAFREGASLLYQSTTWSVNLV